MSSSTSMSSLLLEAGFLVLAILELILIWIFMKWVKRVRAIEFELILHMQEVELLDYMFRENEEVIAHMGDEPPISVQKARQLCQFHQDMLNGNLASNGLRRGFETTSLTRAKKLKLVWHKDEWEKVLRLYRGSVFSLRDLCADIRMHTQLRNMTAAMSRLDQEFAGAPSAKELVDLQGDDFFIIAYIQAQNLSDHPHLPRDRRAVPATLKLDTGASIDHVSESFLLDVLKLKKQSFLPIPEHEQEPVTGFDGTQFTPRYRVKLQWSRELNKEMKSHMFLVVPNCPCDVVLGARNFLQQATGLTRRIQIAAGGRLTESEQQRRDEVINAERERERVRFEEAKARRAQRLWTRRSSTSREEDIEMQTQSGPSSASAEEDLVNTA
ncbi:uncharacterized protein FSUBG_11456 [Fusarium subglutinans]|uniref:Uncharacterized protein n=1 Tax=Gibberella subglutinans TaxID=42677 RepID=A0A8H5L906_GIBSU|nr:uncharacterized protein FSUBG_11456 [Fusarium subglutinans]KAF5588599.1 hypothetical protein FSUBG_11456 [Fusarium subglutinans]